MDKKTIMENYIREANEKGAFTGTWLYAENGEIVVALLGDEATVKRFCRRDGHVLLLPENEAYEPIDGDEASLLGLVRAVVRTYG